MHVEFRDIMIREISAPNKSSKANNVAATLAIQQVKKGEDIQLVKAVANTEAKAELKTEIESYAKTATKNDGFVQMFNGKDLAGWNSGGNWVVEKGNIITLKPRPGERGWSRYKDYLTTDRKYGNFVLDLEFKFNAKGNSGVFMRIGDLKNHVTSGFEVQILDTHGKKKFGAHDCGGVIGTSAPSKMMVKTAGEWNRYTITVKDSQLKVILNGVQIQDLDLSKSKLKDRPAKGYISFQDEAKRIWYRNVRIKELK
jgi:hypothetical protein